MTDKKLTCPFCRQAVLWHGGKMWEHARLEHVAAGLLAKELLLSWKDRVMINHSAVCLAQDRDGDAWVAARWRALRPP